MYSIVFSLLLTCVSTSYSDLLTNCSYEDTVGNWLLHIGKADLTNQINCRESFDVESIISVQLLFPDKVVDTDGNVGTWTMIYNQGFELILNGRRYFAFQKYSSGRSVCSQTFNGWVHDIVDSDIFPPKNWGCYLGFKKDEHSKVFTNKDLPLSHLDALSNKYKINEDFIKHINQVQGAWKAGVYEVYSNMTVYDLLQRAGGKKYGERVHPIKNVDQALVLLADSLPEHIDWRNKDGVNFISPVRNQGTCGSCYAFASMALLEANVRIATNNKKQPIFSTQDVVSCSQYSQGCGGGFPYLVAGKYAQDFGVIEETDYPYIGNTTQCQRPTQVNKTFVSTYGYVGGFYGGCHESLMKIHLAKKGPLAVSIEVYNDLMFYKGGIYIHTGLNDGFNPWEITNHVVLVVGYGMDQETGLKYWTVKNSWGTHWGENGYFRIRRGTDEVAIESMAVYAYPAL